LVRLAVKIMLIITCSNNNNNNNTFHLVDAGKVKQSCDRASTVWLKVLYYVLLPKQLSLFM